MIQKNKIKKKIEDVDEKIPNTSELIKKNDLNTKIARVENKVSSVTSLLTPNTHNAKVPEMENKMPSISNLVKKSDYNTKLQKFKINATTPEFNKLPGEIFEVKIKQANLAIQENFGNFTLDKKLANLATKAELESKQKQKTKKMLQTFDSSCVRGKSRFEDNGA